MPGGPTNSDLAVQIAEVAGKVQTANESSMVRFTDLQRQLDIFISTQSTQSRDIAELRLNHSEMKGAISATRWIGGVIIGLITLVLSAWEAIRR